MLDCFVCGLNDVCEVCGSDCSCSDCLHSYVVVGFGFKRVFCSPDDRAAFLTARKIAAENKLFSWLCFDRFGDLIGCNPD